MGKVFLHEYVDETFSNQAGFIALTKIKELINDSVEPLVVSLSKLDIMSSSFFNSSFGALIEEMGSERFKQKIKITDVNKNHLWVLRKYFSDYGLNQNS